MPKQQQRKRQIKQQRAQEAQNQRDKKGKAKSRKSPKGNIVFVVFLVSVILAFAVWQYTEGQKPPSIGGSSDGSFLGGLAPDFTHRDINGNTVTLSQLKDRVVAIHFMAVGCGGQINQVNHYQLTQLNSVCNSFCSDNSASFLTVAVATCENSELNQIRSNYGVTWIFGNDYDDGVLDIVNAYIPQGIEDGTVVLIDKTFNIVEVYRGGVSTDVLSSKISQLLEN